MEDLNVLSRDIVLGLFRLAGIAEDDEMHQDMLDSCVVDIRCVYCAIKSSGPRRRHDR
jgi:hypothetical protein